MDISFQIYRYIFTVEVSKHGVSSEAQTTVVVVPGIPVLVNMPPGAHLNLVNPKEGVTITAVVRNTREGCRMWWSVQQEPGHEYFNLAEVVGLGDTVHVTLEEAKDALGRLVTHYLCLWNFEATLFLHNSINKLLVFVYLCVTICFVFCYGC
jgi:hypothetical protein